VPGGKSAVDNIGRALYLLGDLAQAEKMLQRAVEIAQKALDTGFDKLDLKEFRPAYFPCTSAAPNDLRLNRQKNWLIEAYPLCPDLAILPSSRSAARRAGTWTLQPNYERCVDYP